MAVRHAERFVVQPGDCTRLDQFLARHVSGCSRRLARTAIASGAVRVNARPGRKGQTLQVGDVVDAELAILDSEPAAQPELGLPILYADHVLVAVDKPAGMPAVALRTDDRNTVANFLLGRFPDLRGAGGSVFEAGLAHRLDSPTSGVLVAARTREAWQDLRTQFRTRRVAKLYLAVVIGAVARRGTVTSPIAHQPRRPRAMCVCTDPQRARAWRARPAITRYRPLRRGDSRTLLAVSIPTGARHQIRVHLASIGHPVVGDTLYGNASASTSPRLLLHAVRLAFAHPVDGRRIVVRSPVPADIRDAALHG